MLHCGRRVILLQRCGQSADGDSLLPTHNFCQAHIDAPADFCEQHFLPDSIITLFTQRFA
jgi:hypothetical protein